MENKNGDDNLLVINDINSYKLGLKKEKTTIFTRKKLFIFSGILLFTIIVIIIIIIILTKKSSNNNNDGTNPEEKEEIPDIGRIECNYNENNGNIQILSEYFIKSSHFDI